MFKYLIFATCIVGALSASFRQGLVPMLDGRIVGGKPVEISAYPHQISMQYYGSHRCGGSLIGDGSVVLTAAHCVEGVSPRSLQVRAGSSYHNTAGQLINVAKIHQHESYNAWNIDYDVAIMILEEPVKISLDAAPIQLNEQEMRGGESARISGWGATREGGSIPRQLQAAQITIVDRKTCEKKYSGYEITPRMICGGVTNGGVDSCQGDSGGPLIVGGRQAGVVSWGAGCARPQYPGVYTNVHSLLDWIKSHMA